jgi:hypothetical protein
VLQAARSTAFRVHPLLVEVEHAEELCEAGRRPDLVLWWNAEILWVLVGGYRPTIRKCAELETVEKARASLLP